MTTLLERLERNAPIGDPWRIANYWKGKVKELLSGGRPMLTKRQAECLQAIRDLIQEQGEPPTYREIGERMGGIRAGNIFIFVQHLEAKGYLVRKLGRERGISLVEMDETIKSFDK